MRGAALLLIAVAGCHAAPVILGCPEGSGEVPSPPMAIVADNVSDRLELYTAGATVERVGCWSVHTNAAYQPNEPFDLKVSPARDTLYVVMGHSIGADSGTLLQLRLSDGARLGEVVVGTQPSTMALSSDGKRAYVALFRNLAAPSGPWTEAGAVAVVDTAAMQVVATVEVCAAPMGVALDEARGRLWVACLGDARLALVDVSGAPKLDRYVALSDGNGAGSQPAYVVLDGAHAFVTAQGSGELWIFDQASAGVVKRLPFGSEALPQRLALAADGKLVLVSVDYGHRLAAVSTSALEELASVTLPEVDPQGIALSRDGSYALVTDENDLKLPGRLVRVALGGLLAGGAHFSGSAPAEVYPQSVLLVE